MSAPGVSVVMPVRNAGSFLDASIGSILEQTFTDFEFAIFDDGSTDGSTELIEDWAHRDERIRWSRSSTPLGLAGSSNAAIRGSSAPLIARMDADDVSHPDRLGRQIEVMEKNDAVLSGTLAEGIDANGSRVRPRDAARVLRKTHLVPFTHGSAMFRRSVFDEVGGYRVEAEGWEDTDLFLRMSGKGRIVVLIDPLYSYRYHRTNTMVALDDSGRYKALAREQRCLDSYRVKGHYEDVIQTPLEEAELNSFALHAAAIRCALAIWSGNRPPPMPNLPRAPAPGWQRALLRLILYKTWGTLSPRSLRRVQAVLVRARDAFTIRRIRAGEVEWHPQL